MSAVGAATMVRNTPIPQNRKTGSTQRIDPIAQSGKPPFLIPVRRDWRRMIVSPANGTELGRTMERLNPG
ncbi:MAG: hypothetical protein ABJO05_00580, partial [Roseibium sp.]